MAAKDKDRGRAEEKKADGKNRAEEKAQEKDGAEGEIPAEGAEGATQPGLSRKKLILFIAAPLVLLIAVGAGLYFTGMLDGLLGRKVECAQDDEKCKAEAAKAGEGGEHGAAAGGEHGAGAVSGLFLPIPTMIVNLASDSEDGAPRYLRLTVQLEMKSLEDLQAVQGVIPRVIDQFQTYLRELRVKDLRGSAGIYRLQMELLWRVNQAAAPVEVKDVLFQEILIQ